MIPEPSCYSKIAFGAVDSNRLRRVLSSGNRTEVVASLGYDDDSAAEVVRSEEFTFVLEESLKATSEAFHGVVVISVEVEISFLAATTSTSISTINAIGESNSTTVTRGCVL